MNIGINIKCCVGLGLLFSFLSAFTPVNEKFTIAETQQISIETPLLFKRYDSFSVDFSILGSNEYCFPLPVGKAKFTEDNLNMEITSIKGDAVKSMFAGVVRLSRNMPSQGHVVVIRHGNGLETVYANNTQNMVKVGQNVKAGQTIAIIGEHNGKYVCKFSIMVNGRKINPSTLLDINSHKLRKQTIVCEKKGKNINVSVINGAQNEGKTSENLLVTESTEAPFGQNSTFKLNLNEIGKEHWAYPLPGSKIISNYGGKRHHSGVDIKTKPKDDVLAAFDGVVTRSCKYGGYGNCIIIKHAYGLETLYSHQHKNLVKVGDKVRAGQIIGLTGRTGRATTEHLHFEVLFKGRHVNPAILFDHTNYKLRNSVLTLYKNGRISSLKH